MRWMVFDVGGTEIKYSVMDETLTRYGSGSVPTPMTCQKDFFEEICDLEDGAEYALLFRVDPARSVYNEAFGNTILGMLLARNPDKRKSLTCNMEDSQDGQNHFWLLKRR